MKKKRARVSYKSNRHGTLKMVTRINTCLKCEQDFKATAVADGVKFVRICERCRTLIRDNERQNGRDYCTNVYEYA